MATSTYRPPQLIFAGLTIPPAASINAAAGQLRTISSAADRMVIPLVYGEIRQPGAVLNILISAADPGAMLVQVLWGHALDGIHDVLLNAEALPAGATVTHYTGAQTTPDAVLVAAFAAQSITYTDTLAGLAYSVVKLPVVDFTGQLTITARLRGRRVYDPRKDSTAPGGSGAHRLATPATWEWSDCPALCLADWTANSAYGAGEAVDWTSVPAAANANDALIGTPAERRRVLGLGIQSAALVADMAEALRAYAGCWLVPTAAGMRLLPDADSAPVASYSHAAGTIADIAPLQLPDRAAAPTVVEVVYTDVSTGEPREASAEASLPGVGTTLPYRRSTVKLLGIQRHSQANREAIERLNKLSLEGVATTLEVFDQGIVHERGDIISVTHPIGLTAATMRVVSVDMAGPGRWVLDLMRHDPLSYSDSVVTAGTIADPSRRINPGPASSVTGAAATVSAGLIRVTWAPCPDTGYDSTEVRTANGDWGSYTVAPLFRGKASEFPYLVTAAGAYTFHLRHISNGNPSAATTTVTLTVTPGDLPGSAAGSPLLSVAPVSALVQADAVGAVSDWSTARATLRVTLPDGSDDTPGWAYTVDSATNVAATLVGTHGNELRVTGFDSGVVDPQYRNALIQVHGYPDAMDTSQYGRAPRSVGGAVSFVNSTTPVGAGFLRLPGSAPWGPGGQVVYGASIYASSPDATLVDVSGQPWVLSAWVRVNAAGGSGPTWRLMGYGAKDVAINTSATGTVFSASWRHEALASFNPTSTTTSLVYGTQVPHNTWVHVAWAYCSDGVIRLFVDGAMRASASLGAGRIDDVHEDGPYSTEFRLGWDPGNWNVNGPEVDLRDVRHLAGVSGPLTSTYTPPTGTFNDSPAPAAGSVTVKASKSGQPDLLGRFDVSFLRAAPPAIVASVSPSALTLDADWQGNVTGGSLVATYSVLVDGVARIGDWGIVTNPDQISGLTATISGATVTATGMSAARASGQLRAWMSSPGFPAQQLLIGVTKRATSQPVVIPGGPASMTVNANWADTASTNLPLAATISAMNGATNEAASYLWTCTVSAGLTAAISGPTVTLTAMAAGTLIGTISVSGTRSGWPDLKWTIAVSKVVPARPVPVAGGASSVVVAGDTSGSVPNASLPVTTAVKVIEDGADVTSSYLWTATPSAGISVSNGLGSAVLQITGISVGVDAGTITMTGVRGGWPDVSWVISVIKTKLLTPFGQVVSGNPSYSVIADNAAASIKFSSDGQISTRVGSSGLWSIVGNWYWPTTSGAGAGYRIFMRSSGATGFTGPFNQWITLASDVIYTVEAPVVPGGTSVQQYQLANIAVPNDNIVLGNMLVNLISTSQGS